MPRGELDDFFDLEVHMRGEIFLSSLSVDLDSLGGTFS